MIDKPPSFKCLNIRIPTIIPIKGRGFINHGSTLSMRRGLVKPKHKTVRNPAPSLINNAVSVSTILSKMLLGFRVQGLGYWGTTWKAE